MLRILKTLAIGTFLIILALFLYPWVLRGLGYYVDMTGSQVAEIAVQKKDVSICKNIVVYARFLGPTAGSRTRECIYTYAELTKDPSACELLMPSDYGFSCVGAAEAVSYQCTLDYGRVIEWGSYIDNTHERATLAECISGSVTSALGKDCCTISKAANIQGFDDCSSLESNSSLHDVCLSYLALKLGVSNSCNQITEPSMKSACMLRVKYKSVLKDWPTPISMEDAKKLN